MYQNFSSPQPQNPNKPNTNDMVVWFTPCGFPKAFLGAFLVDTKQDFFFLDVWVDCGTICFPLRYEAVSGRNTCNKELYFLLHTNMSAGVL